MLGDQHGDALGDMGAGDLAAARAEAELARPHHRLVGDSSEEVFVDFDVGVFVFPVVEEGGADAVVAAACEEGEGGSAGKVGAAGEGRDFAGLEVDFGEGGVFLWVEVLGGVGVA